MLRPAGILHRQTIIDWGDQYFARVGRSPLPSPPRRCRVKTRLLATLVTELKLSIQKRWVWCHSIIIRACNVLWCCAIFQTFCTRMRCWLLRVPRFERITITQEIQETYVYVYVDVISASVTHHQWCSGLRNFKHFSNVQSYVTDRRYRRPLRTTVV